MAEAKTPGQALERRPTLLEKLGAKYMPGTEKAEVLSILNQTAFKTKDGPPTNAQVAALLVVADQYGLNPWTREIFAFPDKQNGIVPVVGIDGWNRIANEHPQYDGEELELAPRDEWLQIDEDAKLAPAYITVRVHRKDRTHPAEHTEYLDECYRPPFEGNGRNGAYKKAGPWQSHTKRMLEHKARIQARRIAFGFAGIYDEDEAERIVEAHYDVEGTAVEVDEIGDAGWKQLLAIAKGYGYQDAERLLLTNAEALGHAGSGAQMSRDVADRLRAAMESSCGGDDDPDDEPDSAEPEAEEAPLEGEVVGDASEDPEASPEAADAEDDGEIPGMDGEAFRRARQSRSAATPKRSASEIAAGLEAEARAREARTPSRGTVTAPQLTRICAQCGELERLGLGEAEWRAFMREGWKVEHRDELSRTAATAVIDELQAWIGRVRSETEAGAA